MPLYDFECRACGPFTQLRSMAESGAPCACPACGASAAKVFPIVHLREMRPENRTAWERNERSAHAPHVCSAGCSHGPGSKPAASRSRPEKPAARGSTKRNRRPWMLGH